MPLCVHTIISFQNCGAEYRCIATALVKRVLDPIVDHGGAWQKNAQLLLPNCHTADK